MKPTFWLLNLTLVFGQDCPDDFILAENKVSCLKHEKTKINWAAAEAHCNSMGANLVTIQDQQKQNEVN